MLPRNVSAPVPQGLSPAITDTSAEVRARRSAVPGGEMAVVMSTTRNRKRVTLAPELLVNLRRISSVPREPLATGVKLRIRFGLAELGTHGKTSEALMVALR